MFYKTATEWHTVYTVYYSTHVLYFVFSAYYWYYTSLGNSITFQVLHTHRIYQQTHTAQLEVSTIYCTNDQFWCQGSRKVWHFQCKNKMTMMPHNNWFTDLYSSYRHSAVLVLLYLYLQVQCYCTYSTSLQNSSNQVVDVFINTFDKDIWFLFKMSVCRLLKSGKEMVSSSWLLSKMSSSRSLKYSRPSNDLAEFEEKKSRWIKSHIPSLMMYCYNVNVH